MNKILIATFLCIVLLASGCANEEIAQKPNPSDAADIVTADGDAASDIAEPAEEEIPAQATEVIPAQNDKSINDSEQVYSKLQESEKSAATATPGAGAVGFDRSATPDGLASREPLAGDVPTARPSPGSSAKTWHDTVYEDVWVVDIPASSYEEPVYEWKSRAICNTCEADITADIIGHGKSHTLNEENFSYRGEDYEVQTGTRMVNVPEQGHFEKKLVKEAGYY